MLLFAGSAHHLTQVSPTVFSELRVWRDRLLADERFQRWVMRTPLLRSYARRHAASLFGLCTGFIQSQLLFVTIRVGLLQALREQPLSAAELQRRCGLTAANLRLLLLATDAMRLTRLRRDETRGLGLLGAALLGNPAVLHMIEHQPLFYADMGGALQLLQGTAAPGQLANYWGYARNQLPEHLGETAIGGYTRLMSATQSLVAQDLLQTYDFGAHRRLLDVGGGDGTFLCAVARQCPQLSLMLFDLPAVAERARARLQEAGLSARASVHAGDFAGVALPGGADVVTLVRVVHDHDDPAALALLQSVRRALPAQGCVVIAEPMRAVSGSLSAADMYLDFYLLAMGQGRLRSPAQIQTLLQKAGFIRVRTQHTDRPWQCTVVSAQNPAKC